MGTWFRIGDAFKRAAGAEKAAQRAAMPLKGAITGDRACKSWDAPLFIARPPPSWLKQMETECDPQQLLLIVWSDGRLPVFWASAVSVTHSYGQMAMDAPEYNVYVLDHDFDLDGKPARQVLSLCICNACVIDENYKRTRLLMCC